MFVGSASEGILYPGDKLASINYQDATKMTHLQAQNSMKTAGTSVKLDVARPGLEASRGSFESQGQYNVPLSRFDLDLYTILPSMILLIY